MMPHRNRILLLDLYELFTTKPYIQPYLYLGAFFDHLHLEYELYRWADDDAALIDRIEQGKIGYVFINLIMGPVLGLVESICRLIKQSQPSVQIWVGGIAGFYIRDLLERCPYIDRVSAGHPRYDPKAFARELYQQGLLTKLPQGEIQFPPLVTNKYMETFLHQHSGINQSVLTTINMSTSSGCKHRCSFCYLAQTKSWIQPIEDLFEDLVSLQAQYNVRYFEFSDDNFPEDRHRLRAFQDKVRETGLDISYFCLASIDVLDAETLDLMFEGGLKRLFIGVDALHSERIRQLNKNYTREKLLETIALVRSYPIDLTLSLVMGNPGETPEQIQELYDWAKSVNPEICYGQFLTPYPKTPTFYQAQRLGFQPPDSLAGWAAVADFEKPKTLLNPIMSDDEYLEWGMKFRQLSTRQFRSDIGESVRRTRLSEE